MRRVRGLGGTWLLGVVVLGCTGSQGPQGNPGADGVNGKDGSGSPSVSAVTPAYAFLGRTVDVTIAGSGTSWSGSTQVAFADPKVKVNKVTAASATGLLVNVTVDSAATVGATDVTVTDGNDVEAYKSAFEIKAPLAVTTDQQGTVPQGGFANVHARLLDVTTPFDAATTHVTLSVADVVPAGTPATTDFGIDLLVGADVLANPQSVDLVVSSGANADAVASTARAAFSVAARAPIVLTPSKGGSGTISTTSDSALYQFTPAAATTRFVQFKVASPDGGGVACMVVPKSGKLADALGFFGVRFGKGMNTTDAAYLIATHGGSPFATPPPYGFSLAVVESPCTAVAETTSVHDAFAKAQAVTAPALVQGGLGGSSAGAPDWYEITVSGSPTAPKKIHAASGGDGVSDVSIELFDTDGTTSLGADAGDDYHKDVVSSDISKAGTYFVKISPSSNFNPAHSTYDLFVEIQ
jgi:hypothetical protein